MARTMITMNDIKLDSPEAIKSFLGDIDKIKFQVAKESRYEWVSATLLDFKPFFLPAPSALFEKMAKVQQGSAYYINRP